MTTTVAPSGQVTVTVTSAPNGTGAAAAAADTSASTLSLIYIYSTSTSSEPTETSSSSSDHPTPVSGGVIAGIVVACIAFLVLMSLALFCYSRKVARKRRAEMASLHTSRKTAPSRAYSPATTAQGTFEGHNPNRESQYARSVGAPSSGTGTRTLSRSFKSPSPMPSFPPPAELPASHTSRKVRMVSVHRPRPEVAEMYGSYSHPIELQAGSTTDLVKALGGEGGGGRGDRRDSDVGSRGYMSPEPDWRSSGRRGSFGTETEYDADYGTADGASIHIYYRSSAATIAQAMSQASLRKATSTKASRSTMRSSSTPYFSQTSLADTAR